MTFRELNIHIHRYIGLATAIFLIITAITGMVLPFYDPLDEWFNQRLAYVEPSNSAVLPIAVLHDKVVASFPDKKFSSMPVQIKPNRSVKFVVDRQPQKPNQPQVKPTFNQVFVNPYTGQIIGTRNQNMWAWQNTMYKVFWFHRNLLLDNFGKTVMGMVGLLWTINCFIGFYLTFPRRPAKKKQKPTTTSQPNRLKNWFQRWSRVWKIRKFSSVFKLNFDMHHAFGLWFWGLSLMVAWSSVGFNLKPVYQPVMQAVVGLKQPAPKPIIEKYQEVQSDPINTLAIDKYHAIDTLIQIARTQSQQTGKSFERPLSLRWLSDEQAWQLRFTTNEDFGTGRGASSVTVDAVTGNVEKVTFGSEANFGNRVEQVIYAIHLAQIDSIAYRLFLSVFGVIVTILSVTGVYLWWHGHKNRRHAKHRHAKQKFAKKIRKESMS